MGHENIYVEGMIPRKLIRLHHRRTHFGEW